MTASSPSRRLERLERMPGYQRLRDLPIGRKLTLGFGALVALALMVAGLSLLASSGATLTIRSADRQRLPTALAASQAQANLLRMQSSIRGYLALGDPEIRQSYEAARQAFVADLTGLKALEANMDPANQRRLAELEETFVEWSALPEQLFDLRDDRLKREPAYQVLATEGVLYGGQVLLDLQQMIDSQALQTPSPESVALLRDMASFQGSFAAMLSGLRNYTTTQNRIFRQEYEANLVQNELAWQTLLGKSARGLLTANQRQLLASIQENRERFLALPEQKIFPVLEAEDGRYRTDLYRFTQEAVPRAELMLDLLSDITRDEQASLQNELRRGNQGLVVARARTVAGGLLAVLVGGALSLLLRAIIVGPVGQLTATAEQISQGDLEAQARVESGDEIGVLARTFNRMTGQLRTSLNQVRKEKKRAGDLLNVVIPIGVQLSSEKDFNRLLETMLMEAKAFCHADAGTLYLRTEDDTLRFVLARNDSLDITYGAGGQEVPYNALPLYDESGQPNRRNVAARVALSGETVNIADAYKVDDFDFAGPAEFDARVGYHTISMLTLPLKNSRSRVLGVLQLINAREAETGQIIPFDPNLQQMMESFSSLAAAALEAYSREQSLRQEIKQLRIEIDEVKLKQQVSQTVETDFFQDLQVKARDIRRRRQRAREPRESQE